jgi:DNA-binding NtrC family response regulator
VAKQSDAFDATASHVGAHLLGGRPLVALARVEGALADPRQLSLASGTYVVGSAPDCALRIEDRTVSRHHLELEPCAEGVRVRDLGSRNGTFFLGQRMERFTAVFGAQLQVGNVTLRIDVDRTSLDEGAVFDGDRYRELAGSAPPMRRLFATLVRLEPSLVTALVEGESGTGKELVARAIHDASQVSSGPFVAVNCGGIQRELVASELFGHKKGAFTHAVETRKGAFESADGGTLFLDEIGELPLDVQPTLLRVLESGELRSVGSDDVRRVRVRVLAATNRDLEAESRQGSFRQDLYFRLAVIKLKVPALRERAVDIPLLAQKFAAELGLAELGPGVLAELASRAYPGNVRELRNAVAAYSVLGVVPPASSGDVAILDLALSQFVDLNNTYASQKEAIIDRFTAHYLRALMGKTGGNQSRASAIAGLDRGYVGKLLAKLGMKQ